MGMITPLAHVAQQVLPYTENMSFAQRYYSSMLSIYTWFVRYYFHYPWHNEISNKYFAHLEQPLPTIQQLRKNVSVIFVNVHRSMAYPRPHLPGLVYIGGAHIKPQPKALPTDLQTFIDESKHGVIYFSLGSWIKSAHMPKEKLDIFLGKTFILNSNFFVLALKQFLFFILLVLISYRYFPSTQATCHLEIRKGIDSKSTEKCSNS